MNALIYPLQGRLIRSDFISEEHIYRAARLCHPLSSAPFSGLPQNHLISYSSESTSCLSSRCLSLSLSRNFSNLAERPHSALNGRRSRLGSHNHPSGFSICRHTSGDTFSFLVSLRVDLSHLPSRSSPCAEKSVAKSQTESNFLASGGCRTNCRRSFGLAFPFSLSLHSSDRWECPALSGYAFRDDAPPCKSKRRSIERLVDEIIPIFPAIH